MRLHDNRLHLLSSDNNHILPVFNFNHLDMHIQKIEPPQSNLDLFLVKEAMIWTDRKSHILYLKRYMLKKRILYHDFHEQ